MNASRNIFLWMIVGFINVAAFSARADVVYYILDNVMLDDGTQMTGTFSWTFDAGDFDNGVGEFTSLIIPNTSHNQDDLNVSFDIGKSIEITLPGSVHDDGVDISLVLLRPLTSGTSSGINLIESKYEIGGNGFHDGLFLGGNISPVSLSLSIAPASPGFATISWEPDIPGHVLQETPGLTPTNWVDSASGSTNPVVVPTTAPTKFYRVVKP